MTILQKLAVSFYETCHSKPKRKETLFAYKNMCKDGMTFGLGAKLLNVPIICKYIFIEIGVVSRAGGRYLHLGLEIEAQPSGDLGPVDSPVELFLRSGLEMIPGVSTTLQ